LQTSQSFKEDGKPELSWATGPRAEIRPATIGSGETRGESGLPLLTRLDSLALFGGTGKNTVS
jgi:hypothetical protein